MFNFDPDVEVYLYKDPVDFRKQINGLALMVQELIGINPMSPAVFVFTNRRATSIKILWWHRNGFCLFQKRLEKHRFVWPFDHDGDVLQLNGELLSYLLAGLDIFRIPPHQQLIYGAVG